MNIWNRIHIALFSKNVVIKFHFCYSEAVLSLKMIYKLVALVLSLIFEVQLPFLVSSSRNFVTEHSILILVTLVSIACFLCFAIFIQDRKLQIIVYHLMIVKICLFSILTILIIKILIEENYSNGTIFYGYFIFTLFCVINIGIAFFIWEEITRIKNHPKLTVDLPPTYEEATNRNPEQAV